MKHSRMDNNNNQNQNENFQNPFHNGGGGNINHQNINNGIFEGVPSLNYEDHILQNIMINSSEYTDQPILDFHDTLNADDPGIGGFYSPPELIPSTAATTFRNNNGNQVDNPTLYNNSVQQQFKMEAGTPSGSPLPYNEDKVNLANITQNQEQSPNGNYIASNPLLVLSILPWTGPYNFRINIPEPSLMGVKPKWCFSKSLNRIYVAKNIAFPVNVMLDTYPVGAHLNFCPVYNKSSNRMTPVRRCPNCRLSDPNQESCQHVIQIEGSSSYYYIQEDRYMVSSSLGTPAPGDSLVNMFLKVCCNTSCTGGPNRRTFSILISLKLGEKEYGRQVIDVKCCEGPTRDMTRDEKNQIKEEFLQPLNQNTNENIERVREVASEVAKSRCTKTKQSQKRKANCESPFNEQQQQQQQHNELGEMEMIMVPKKYVKRVKKYVNMMYLKDHFKKVSRQHYSNSKIFPASTSESEN